MNSAANRLRNTRSMPTWMVRKIWNAIKFRRFEISISFQNEVNHSIGPKPPAPPTHANGTNNNFKPPVIPPKKIQPDPDYEIIEFSGQQYSNATISKS